MTVAEGIPPSQISIRQAQPKRWQRTGDPEDFIGTINVAEYEIYAQAVERLIGTGTLPDSGIVICNDRNLAEGGRIEKSCYRDGGFKFLIRPRNQVAESNSELFPSRPLAALLEHVGDLYLSDVVDIKGRRACLDACWAVCQRDGDYGTLHNHIPPQGAADARYSGTFYLRTPVSINPYTFPNGCLHLVTDGGGIVYVPPIPGTITVWPSRLIHGIHPFRGDGDRLAIAFDFVSKMRN